MEKTVAINELAAFARQFWDYAAGYKVFAFHGNMGAGKTTIINALCHQKGVTDVTASPTFAIINEYSLTEHGREDRIFHIDLYRLRDEAEAINAGVEDCLASGKVCLVEWPEKAPSLFDDATVHVIIEPVSESQRHICIKLPTSKASSKNNRNL